MFVSTGVWVLCLSLVYHYHYSGREGICSWKLSLNCWLLNIGDFLFNLDWIVQAFNVRTKGLYLSSSTMGVSIMNVVKGVQYMNFYHSLIPLEPWHYRSCLLRSFSISYYVHKLVVDSFEVKSFAKFAMILF